MESAEEAQRGGVPDLVEIEKGAFFRWVTTTTKASPGRATGGMRRGQWYQEPEGC